MCKRVERFRVGGFERLSQQANTLGIDLGFTDLIVNVREFGEFHVLRRDRRRLACGERFRTFLTRRRLACGPGKLVYANSVREGLGIILA